MYCTEMVPAGIYLPVVYSTEASRKVQGGVLQVVLSDTLSSVMAEIDMLGCGAIVDGCTQDWSARSVGMSAADTTDWLAGSMSGDV